MTTDWVPPPPRPRAICAECSHYVKIPSLRACSALVKKTVSPVTGKIREIGHVECRFKNSDGQCKDFRPKGEAPPPPEISNPLEPEHHIEGGPPPPSTPMPPPRMLRESDPYGWCPECGSSQKRRFLFFGTGFCIGDEACSRSWEREKKRREATRGSYR